MSCYRQIIVNYYIWIYKIIFSEIKYKLLKISSTKRNIICGNYNFGKRLAIYYYQQYNHININNNIDGSFDHVWSFFMPSPRIKLVRVILLISLSSSNLTLICIHKSIICLLAIDSLLISKVLSLLIHPTHLHEG